MALVVGEAEIDVNIPEDATLAQIEVTLSRTIDGYTRLEAARERLAPVIGRILLTVAQRKLWRPAWKNFTAYVKGVVEARMGFGRSKAFDALAIARAFPSLTAEQYGRYGATRLRLAAKITDEQEPAWQEVLDEALKVPVLTFGATVKQLHGTPTKETLILSLRLPKAVKGDWDAALLNSELSGPELLAAMVAMWTVAQVQVRRVAGAHTAQSNAHAA